MGIPEALRALNDFYRDETGMTAPSAMCKCGHGLRHHRHELGDKSTREPCRCKGCLCRDYRPASLKD